MLRSAAQSLVNVLTRRANDNSHITSDEELEMTAILQPKIRRTRTKTLPSTNLIPIVPAPHYMLSSPTNSPITISSSSGDELVFPITGRPSFLATPLKTLEVDGFNELYGEDALNALKSLCDYHLQRECLLGVQDYRPRQPMVDATTRAQLIGWLIEVVLHFDMHRETLYLAVYLVDRFLTLSPPLTDKAQLQVIGVTCLLIAGKCEEISPPNLPGLAGMTDGLCTPQYIAQWELYLVKTLRWHLCYASPAYWIGLFSYHVRLLRVDNINEHELLRTLDVVLMSSMAIEYSYSILAASCLYLALQNSNLVMQITGYHVSSYETCAQHINVMLEECPCMIDFPSDHTAVIQNKHHDKDKQEIYDDFLNTAIVANAAILDYILVF